MNINFRKSDSRMDDGQKQQSTDNKIIGGITEPEITTVDGQKNYRGRQKPYRGAKNSGEQKEKKVAIKKWFVEPKVCRGRQKATEPKVAQRYATDSRHGAALLYRVRGHHLVMHRV